MIKKIKIPKSILIVCCLFASIISIKKLDALTYNSYLRLDGSSSYLNPGYSTSIGSNSSLTFISLYNIEGTGGLDYYITTTLQMCSTGFYSITVNSEDSVFTISKTIKDIGNCEVSGFTGTLYEIKWVRYLPVVNGFDQAVGQVFVETSPLNYNNFHKFVSTNLTVQTAQVYEQQQTISKIDETNDFLKDDTAPNSDISALGNVQGLLPPGPVDSLLNIPFTFLSIVVSSLSGTCVPLTGDFVFGSTLSIPCFGDTFYSNVPSGLMIFINLIPSAFILIHYLKHLYKKVDRAVSLQTTTEDEWGVI